MFRTACRPPRCGEAHERGHGYGGSSVLPWRSRHLGFRSAWCERGLDILHRNAHFHCFVVLRGWIVPGPKEDEEASQDAIGALPGGSLVKLSLGKPECYSAEHERSFGP